MKIKFHTMAIWTTAIASLFASRAFSDEALVAHFNFDEGSGTVVGDSSRFGNHGAIKGATYVEVGEGYALQFDGEDDHVKIPDAGHLKIGGDLSVVAWVNPAVNTTGCVLSKNGCSTLRQNYLLSMEEGSIRFGLTECPEIERQVRSRSLDKDVWQHLVGTFNGKLLKIYIDGELAATHAYDRFDAGTLGNPLYIGASFYGTGLFGFFTGQIDDVRVFSRTLSAQEIAASYQEDKHRRISPFTAMLAQLSAFDEIDTTPPTLNRPAPPPDSTVSGPVTIAANFADRGTGIDASSARIKLNGHDVTANAKISIKGFSLSPSVMLEPGMHDVEVTVADEAGNLGNRLKWTFGVDEAVTVKVRFRDGIFLVNGEPFFPLGLYGGNSSTRTQLPFFSQAAEAGVNYRLVGESTTTEQLNRYVKYNTKALMQLHYSALAMEKGDSAPLELVIAKKKHPAILGWWNEYSGEAQKDLAIKVRDFVKQRDPNHPVAYMLGWAGEISDVHFVYAYPILNPLLPNSDIMSQVRGTIQPAVDAAKAEGKGKQIWFISQAFDYRIDNGRGKIVTLEGGFRPSREELRAMNYLALAKGIKGICYYAPGSEIAGTDYVDDVAIYPRQWTELLKTASEVRHLTPTLAAGAPAATVELANDNPAIHFREWNHQGVHTLIAVNVEHTLSLANWSFESAVQPKVLFENRQCAGPSTSVTDIFQPLEVHIYQW